MDGRRLTWRSQPLHVGGAHVTPTNQHTAPHQTHDNTTRPHMTYTHRHTDGQYRTQRDGSRLVAENSGGVSGQQNAPLVSSVWRLVRSFEEGGRHGRRFGFIGEQRRDGRRSDTRLTAAAR